MKLKDLLITFKHSIRVPPKRLLYRLRYVLLKRIFIRSSLKDLNIYTHLPTSYDSDNFSSVAEAILKARASMFSVNSKDIFNGKLTLRGETRQIGPLFEFNWKKLQSPKEEDVNWYYELCYLGYFASVVEQLQPSDFKGVAKITEALNTESEGLDWSQTLIWKPVSCANRLINISLILHTATQKGIDKKVINQISEHAQLCSSIVNRLCEYHLHYNHLAFCLVSSFVWKLLTNENIKKEDVDYIIGTLEEQLLQDGGQAERSPTYHIHVLFLAKLVRCSNKIDTNQAQRLSLILTKMISALNVMSHLDGDISVFNDSALNDAPPSHLFLQSAPVLTGIHTLPYTGYGQLNSNNLRFILDGGNPGPSDNPGHGHADYLSFELSIGSSRFIVDPGVSSYLAGESRDQCRASKCHNGPSLNQELLEMSGAFRIGSYSTAKLVELTKASNLKGLIATCSPFFNGKKQLTRALVELMPGEVAVIDIWNGISAKDVQPTNYIINGDWISVAFNTFQNKSNDSRCLIDTVYGTSFTSEPKPYWPNGPGKPKTGHSISVTPKPYNDILVSTLVISSTPAPTSRPNEKEISRLISLVLDAIGK